MLNQGQCLASQEKRYKQGLKSELGHQKIYIVEGMDSAELVQQNQ